MTKKKPITIAMTALFFVVLAVAAVVLTSFFRPIPLGSVGRPEGTDLRLLDPGLEVDAYVEAADAFVMLPRAGEGPEDVEGFGIVYLEAAYFGLPIVASVSGGSAEACPHARFVHPADHRHVAAAIADLLSASAARAEAVAAGKRHAESLSYDRLAGELVRSLEALG